MDNNSLPETRPQLQTSRKKRLWTPQEKMAMRRCRNRLNDLSMEEDDDEILVAKFIWKNQT